MAKIVSLYSKPIIAFVEEETITPPVDPFPVQDFRIEEIYSDVNQFTPVRAAKIFDLDSVFQSIGNILSTPVGTRLFNPEFGSNVPDLLFDPMDEITKIRLIDESIMSIQRWEPRVNVIPGLSRVTENVEMHTYFVSLVMEVLGLPDRFTYTGVLAAHAGGISGVVQ